MDPLSGEDVLLGKVLENWELYMTVARTGLKIKKMAALYTDI